MIKHKNPFFLLSFILIFLLLCSCSKNVKNTNKTVFTGSIDELGQQNNTTIYPKEYLGLWHGYGNDSTESLSVIELTAVDEKTIFVNDTRYTFISRYVGESPSELYSSEVRLIQRLELGADSQGNPALNLYTTNKESGSQCSQAMCCYRDTEKENFQDFVIATSNPNNTSLTITTDEAKIPVDDSDIFETSN